MGFKINDETIKKMETKTDAELAKSFLTSKYLPSLKYETLSDESKRIILLRTKDGSRKYPYYSALEPVERSFFITQLLDRYYSLVHEPKKFDLKLEPIIAAYNEMLEANWRTFEQERIKIEKQAKEKGVEIRDYTTEYNYEIVAKILGVIANIDLTKTDNLTL